MEKLEIIQTAKTPLVVFDANQGLLEIKGRSIPEDPSAFFGPILNWATNYQSMPFSKTIINLQLEYFNTSSSKRILELLKIMEAIYIAKNEVIINWFYEADDDDILEAGETYESMLKVPFNKIEITY